MLVAILAKLKPAICAASTKILIPGRSARMHLSTEFATESDLFDLVMEKGIVVEVWDRVDLAALDVSQMRVTVSVLQLFLEGMNPPFRRGHFLRIKP